MNIYPYVYRIDHPSGEFYIGSRCANRVPAEADFGYIYKTSTKKLSYPFEEYRQTIIAEFYLANGKTDAYDFEQALIFEHWGNPNLANKRCHYGKVRWSTSGKKLTAEHRMKLAEAKIGKARGPQSSEHRQKIREANTGKTLSEERKQKMLGRKLSDATKQKMSEAWRNRPGPSEETKKKMADAARGKRHTDEARQRMIDSWKIRKSQRKDITV